MHALLRTKHYLLNLAPGLPELKQASKPILAILVTLLLLKNDTLSSKLLASICCGMSIQAISPSSFKSRLIQMIVFDFLFIIVFYLGLLVKNSEPWTMILLALLGFIVNYIRQYGLEKSPAPFMIWLLGFIATILPEQSFANYTTPFCIIVLGFSVSAPFILFVFPPTAPMTNYLNNTNKIISLLAQGIQAFATHPPDDWLKTDERLTYQRIEKQLYAYLSSNEQLFHLNPLKIEDDQKMKIQELNYALVNAYSMLVHSFNSISVQSFKLPNDVLDALHFNSLQLIYLLISLDVTKMSSTKAELLSIELLNIIELITKHSLEQKELLMPLIQMQHSFSLIKLHVEKFILGNNVDK